MQSLFDSRTVRLGVVYDQTRQLCRRVYDCVIDGLIFVGFYPYKKRILRICAMNDTACHDRTDHDGMIVETLTLIEALEAESKCECFVQAKKMAWKYL
jgi:hypothetical protein